MLLTSTELVTVAPSKVIAGWKGVWTSANFQERYRSSHCIPLWSPHLLPTARRKVEDVVFSTQEVALPGHSEDFICVPWRWGSKYIDSDSCFMQLRVKNRKWELLAVIKKRHQQWVSESRFSWGQARSLWLIKWSIYSTRIFDKKDASGGWHDFQTLREELG